jgi:hypothetical protein
VHQSGGSCPHIYDGQISPNSSLKASILPGREQTRRLVLPAHPASLSVVTKDSPSRGHGHAFDEPGGYGHIADGNGL